MDSIRHRLQFAHSCISWQYRCRRVTTSWQCRAAAKTTTAAAAAVAAANQLLTLCSSLSDWRQALVATASITVVVDLVITTAVTTAATCDVHIQLTQLLAQRRKCSPAVATCNEIVVYLVMSWSVSSSILQTRLARSASVGVQLARSGFLSSLHTVSAVASTLLIASVLLPLPFCRPPLCSASSAFGKSFFGEGIISYSRNWRDILYDYSKDIIITNKYTLKYLGQNTGFKLGAVNEPDFVTLSNNSNKRSLISVILA